MSDISFKDGLDRFTKDFRNYSDNPKYRNQTLADCKSWVFSKSFSRIFDMLVQGLAYGLFFGFCLMMFLSVVYAAILLGNGETWYLSLSIKPIHIIGFFSWFLSLFLLCSTVAFWLRSRFSSRFQYEDWRLLLAAEQGDNGALIHLHGLKLSEDQNR